MDNLQANSAPDPEAALYAAMEKELGDGQEPEKAPEVPVDPPKPEAAAAEPKQEEKKEPDKKAPLSLDELERNYTQVRGALGEARAEMRQYREENQRIKGQFEALQAFLKQQQAPAQPKTAEQEVTDYLGDLEQKATRAEQTTKELRERMEAQQREQETIHRLAEDERAFMATAPDYNEAAQHLANARMAEFRAFFPDDSPEAQRQAAENGFYSVDQMRHAMLRNETLGLVQRANQMRQSPAKLIYDLATSRGYQKPQPKPAAAAAAAPKPLEAVKRGMEASATLSGGGPAGKDPDSVSMNDLAEMFLTDPDRAAELFNKMAKSGQLG